MKVSHNPNNPDGDMMSWQRNFEHDIAVIEAQYQNRAQRLLTSDERWDLPPDSAFIEAAVPVSFHLKNFTTYVRALIPTVEEQIKSLRRA